VHSYGFTDNEGPKQERAQNITTGNVE